jgi:hypothetical protein
MCARADDVRRLDLRVAPARHRGLRAERSARARPVLGRTAADRPDHDGAATAPAADSGAHDVDDHHDDHDPAADDHNLVIRRPDGARIGGE